MSYTKGPWKVSHEPGPVVPTVAVLGQDIDGRGYFVRATRLARDEHLSANARLIASAPAMRDALERIALECESEAMDCECAPPGNGEACPRCEIRYVAREAVERIGTSQEVVDG